MKKSIIIITTVGFFILICMAVPEIFLAQTQQANLSFNSSEYSAKVGQNANAVVNLNTGGANVYGADVMIEFDSSKLTVTNIQPNTSTNLKTFAPTVNTSVEITDPLFNPDFDFQKAVNGGIIEFGATAFNFDPNNDGNYADSAPLSDGFSGSTPLATISFTPLPVRKSILSPLSFFFTEGSTIDSNVVESANLTDILSSVSDSTNIYIIAEDKCRVALDQTNNSVGIDDLAFVINHYSLNTVCESDCQDEDHDLDNDGYITMGDLQRVITYWGQVCTAN